MASQNHYQSIWGQVQNILGSGKQQHEEELDVGQTQSWVRQTNGG